MVMIKCPECSSNVSDRADKCPKCACPISTQMEAKKVQTVEQTSKDLKLQSMLSVIAIVVGVIIMMTADSESSSGSANAYVGGFIAFGGFVWLIVAKVKVWWKHE